MAVKPQAAESVPVVIVGAGPTAVAAATLLAHYGVETLLLERRTGVYPKPRAVHVDDEVCRIIGRLGIAEQFAAISRPAHGLRLLDNHHRVLAELPRDPRDGVHGYPQANMFDQPELERVMRANLARHRCAVLRQDANVTGLVADAHGATEVRYLTDGGRRERRVLARFVLGCDGANSVVRKLIDVGVRDLRFAQRWLVIDVAASAELGQWDGVHQVCDPQRAATFMRIGADRYRFEFQLREGETTTDFEDPAALMGLLSPWTADTAAGELTVIRLAEYTFRAQIAKRWRRGNVFLLGDAAHLTPPFIGQGLGAGIRDAMNLAWKLAGVLHRDLPAEALDSYERERKPHVRNLITLALLMGQMMTAGGRLGNAVRAALIPRLSLVPGIRSRVLDSTTPSLRRSALIDRPMGVRTLAGSLSPNVVLQQDRHLDEVMGGAFALITTAKITAAQRATVQQRGAKVIAVDHRSALGRWLHRGRTATVLVRPDGTVMAAAGHSDPGGLCHLLPHFHPGDRSTAAT